MSYVNSAFGSSGGALLSEQFSFDVLRQMEVSISGEWQPGASRDWHGQANAIEPLVAISFILRGALVSWCKSERANPAGQPVHLRLGHYDSGMRDVQVSFSIGDGQVRSRTLVESPNYRPTIQNEMTIHTASFVPFTNVEGSYDVHVSTLFLAGSDVQVGRNGLWYLRPNLAESVPPKFRKILTRGRTGKMATSPNGEFQ